MEHLKLSFREALRLFAMPVLFVLSLTICCTQLFSDARAGELPWLNYYLMLAACWVAIIFMLSKVENRLFRRARNLAPLIPAADPDGIYSPANRILVANAMCNEIRMDLYKNQYSAHGRINLSSLQGALVLPANEWGAEENVYLNYLSKYIT